MCTVESPIHQNIKDKIVASTEQDTIHMFRSVHSPVLVRVSVPLESPTRIELISEVED